jgi:hypothetical protein
MPSFAKKIKLCLSFAKNMELYQVLPKNKLCVSFAKFMELCQVLPKK